MLAIQLCTVALVAIPVGSVRLLEERYMGPQSVTWIYNTRRLGFSEVQLRLQRGRLADSSDLVLKMQM
jgi:hypothetical protein